MVVPIGESVRMDLTVENKGKQDEVVALKLATVPKGWKASLKGGSFTVTGVAVPDGKTRNAGLHVPSRTREWRPGRTTF